MPAMKKTISDTIESRLDPAMCRIIVLYEMATGRRPFSGNTSGIIFTEILTKAPTAPIRINPDLPMEMERIINKALEKDHETRYQSAKEILIDCREQFFFLARFED
jgi:serine/threonine protein kinase